MFAVIYTASGRKPPAASLPAYVIPRTISCNTCVGGGRRGAAMIALRALRLTMLAFFLWCIVMTLVGVLPW
jgi:hypothetical protein